MSNEIMHLAADGCKSEVILKLLTEGKSDTGITNATVITYCCTKSGRDVGLLLEALDADNTNNADNVFHMGWEVDAQFRKVVGIKNNVEVKSKHLIDYFCKQYKFKLKF
ncbi:hypothetical protein [Photobacterium kishitanii]|uniref:Uncharacterized protein n=1 Tax=Photobacterium kishitanii TaxID=318456 RepID=A0A2T3KKQ8_9GAMM|nr:hypothetical protein [Photobacterium kishitanii]PSV00304.1 hypothetical protein C9J27_04050 [Photobacterium kishitanii]